MKSTNRIPTPSSPALGLVVLTAAAFVLAGCRPAQPGGAAQTSIQNKGSDTMVNVAQAWSESYKQVAPNVDVEVSGGGTGTGIAALIKGAVQIANASRDMKPQEIEQAKKNTGKEPQNFIVGYDALAVYVHKDNPLKEITFEQLAAIYAEGGTITKWSQLNVKIPGCDSDEIKRISRQSSSGTYEFFREHVLNNKDFKLGSNDMNGSKEVVEMVSRTPCAIGYSGMGYATPQVRTLPVAIKTGAQAVLPTVPATMDHSYPIARSLHMYTLGVPEGPLKAYLDWIRSNDGQKIVADTGYVPIAPADRTGQ